MLAQGGSQGGGVEGFWLRDSGSPDPPARPGPARPAPGGKPEAPAQARWDPPGLLNLPTQARFKDLKEFYPGFHRACARGGGQV